MSIWISILIAVLIIGLFSIVWERRWKGLGVDSSEEGKAISSLSTSLTTWVTDQVAAIQSKLPTKEPQIPLADQFREWSMQALASDAEVLSWLNRLSDPAYVAFVEHLAEFSDEMGFELAALVDGQMTGLPKVQHGATEVLLNYCRANYRAALIQQDFDGYRAYAAYLQAPTSPSNQLFTHQFYAKLVEQQVVPAPTPELLELTDQERLAQMQDAIRQASEKSEEFGAVLSAVAIERQRSAADLTVAAIVQRAMEKVVKPTTDASADQTPEQEVSKKADESVAVPA